MKYIDIFIKLIIPFIGLYVLYTAYSYADNLDSCKCADHLKPYIDHIKTVEQIFIVIQLIGIAINIILIIFNPKDAISRIPPAVIKVGFGIYSAFILFIAGYFVRNVWHFEQEFPEALWQEGR